MQSDFLSFYKKIISFFIFFTLTFTSWALSDKNLLKNADSFEILGDINLEGETVIVPSGCSVIFQKGTISNGKIIFNDNRLLGNVSFSDCFFEGNILNDEIPLNWFDKNITETQVKLGNFTKKIYPVKAGFIENIISLCKDKTLIVHKLYCCSESIKIKNKVFIKGLNIPQSVYALIYDNADYGFYFTGNCSGFTVLSGGDLSISGLSILGDSLYISGRLNGTYSTINCCGIEVYKDGFLRQFSHSTVNGFTYGIKIYSKALLNDCVNSYFSCCRFGFWAENADGISFSGCRFNTNLVNYRFYDPQSNGFNCNLEEDDGNLLRKTGGGVYLKNCSNIKFNRCRFEFNNISLFIDERGRNIEVKHSIFDTASVTHIQIYNGSSDSKETGIIIKENYMAMDNIVISGNTFARGVHSDINSQEYFYSHPGLGIIMITENHYSGSKISFINNIVSDRLQIERHLDYVYEKYIFRIFNRPDSENLYIIEGNSFLNAESDFFSTAGNEVSE